MIKLEQLIKECCPNGVDYVPLGTVCQIGKGVQFNKSDMNDEGTYPVINGGINPSGYIEQYNQVENTITISQGGASAGYVNWLDVKFWAGAHCYVIKPKVNLLNRYAYHFIKSQEYKLQECQYGAGIPALAKSTVEALNIPVPPIEVQSEIVRILDNFTELTVELTMELTAELTARKKQYDYYTEQLMNFGENVKKLTLGEIGSVKMCKRILKEQTNTTGGIPFYKIGTFGKTPNAYISEELFDEYRAKYSYPKKGDILISCSGTIGRTVVFDGEPAYFQDSNIVWLEHDGTIVNNKYLLYCYKKQPWQISTGGTIARLYNDNILKAKIPVPPIEEQKRIVDILERFDALYDDIFAGLPVEIEARQKQYEYYRDKLLTFEPAQSKEII